MREEAEKGAKELTHDGKCPSYKNEKGGEKKRKEEKGEEQEKGVQERIKKAEAISVARGYRESISLSSFSFFFYVFFSFLFI